MSTIPQIPAQLFRTKVFDDAGNTERIWRETLLGIHSAAATAVQFLEGTHAARAATNPAQYADGTLYYETDRKIWYTVQGAAWMYAFGTFSCLQAALPVDLTAADAGALVFVTDYQHLLQWSGVAYTWGPGEPGSGEIKLRLDAPVPVAGWHLCDGATFNRLNADGTVAPVTPPDLTTAAYLKLATVAAAGPNAASGVTADTAALNNAAATGVTNQNAVTGVTVNPHAGADDTDGGGSAIKVFNGAGDLAHTVNDPGHTHAVTDPTHNHTQTAHHHAAGTLELRNTQLQAWYRQ